MIDLHKTDALLQVCGMQYGHDEEEDMYYAAILAKHSITQAQFDSSLVWYTKHPQLFDKIYPKVLKELRSEHETFALAHPEVSGSVTDEPVSQSVLSVRIARLQIDSLCWTMRHGAPVYGWNEGWQPKPPTPPYISTQ